MNQVKSGVILSLVYTIIHIFVLLLYVPLLLQSIGQNEYGLYQLVGSVIAYVNIMQSLLSSGVLRFYCKYKALNDEIKMENTLAIAKRIYTLFSVIVAVIGVVLVFLFPLFYQSSLIDSEIKEAQFIIILLIANIIINLMNYVYSAAITANEKFIFLKVIDICSVVIQPIAVLVFAKRFPYALTIVFIQVAINIIVAVSRRIFFKRNLKLKIVYHGKDKQLSRSIIIFSLGVFFASLADQIFWKADQIILGKMYGTAIVAVYAIGSQIYTCYMSIGTAVSSVFMPRISRIYNNGNGYNKLSDIFCKVGRISFFICSAILSGFVLFGQEFIALWAGENYGDAYWIALIVMIPFTIDIIQNIGLTILQVMNKYSFRGKMYLIIAIINVLSTVLLAKFYGSIGAAIATAVSMFLGNGVLMNIYYAKFAGLNIRRFWIEILKIIPSVCMVLIVGHFIKYITVYNEWLTLIIHLAIFVVLYVIVLFLCGINKDEKKLVRSVFMKNKEN